MKLESPFYRLPLTFDAIRLQHEIAQFDSDSWKNHPQEFLGNSVIHFVSVGGEKSDTMLGAMEPTEHLALCPYIKQVMASFNTPIGRARLMILAPGASVPPHTDIHYYWRNRVRIHIPIVTLPEVKFYCEQNSVHMATGEAWVFDNWRQHSVINNSDSIRIHLVIDTLGSADFWRLVRSAESYEALSITSSNVFVKASIETSIKPSDYIAYKEGVNFTFSLEKLAPVAIMHPSEVQQWCQFLLDELIISNNEDINHAALFTNILRDFCYDWQASYVAHENSEYATGELRAAITRAARQLIPLAGKRLLLSNKTPARKVFLQWSEATLNTPLTLPQVANFLPSIKDSPLADFITPKPTLAQSVAEYTPVKPQAPVKRLMDSPVFLVSAPRSGSTLLFETLACADSLWTIGGESHSVFEDIPGLQPGQRDFSSNRLTRDDVSFPVLRQLNLSFITLMQNKKGKRYLTLSEKERNGLGQAFFLEKTPKNALRIDFLKAAYPNARFIYLHRNPRDNISSIIDAWRSGHFCTYPQLPLWVGLPWSMLLTPGWREYINKPVEKVAAHQWQSANQHIIDDLAKLDRTDWCQISYDDFLASPEGEIKRLCDFIGIEFDSSLSRRVKEKLPVSKYTVSAPRKDKWLGNKQELISVLPLVEPMAQSLGYSYDVDAIANG
ncbi:MAG: sulfotransferase [Colwellia sp.]|nr:sulfotransferase [Colwellia sp.]